MSAPVLAPMTESDVASWVWAGADPVNWQIQFFNGGTMTWDVDETVAGADRVGTDTFSAPTQVRVVGVDGGGIPVLPPSNVVVVTI